MGFSMDFMRLARDDIADADREGLAAWLRAQQLEVAPSDDRVHHLAGPAGRLTFDGRWTDLHLDSLDQEEPVTGGIWHATLSNEECDFVYGMCTAGKLLIANPQGAPSFVVPGGTHSAEDIPDGMLDDTAWVNSPEDLQEALCGAFEGFFRFRDQVLGDAARGEE